MTRAAKGRRAWAVVLGLAAGLLAATVPAPASASTPSPSYTETRVRGSNPEIAAGAGAEQAISETGTRGYGLRYNELAVGYPLVPGGPGPAHSAANALRLRNQLAAREIASGHAFEMHVIQRGEFPGVSTQGQFAEVIEGVLNRPTHVRELARGRTAFFDEGSGVLVIRTPAAPDGGTALVPTNGLNYFLGLQ